MARSRRNPDQDRNSRKKSKSKSSYQEKVTEVYNVSPQSAKQQDLMRSINYNPITVCSGAAGVGKTLIALYVGVQMLEHGLVDQILYVKPVVDFRDSKGIGFLPGDLNEKIEPLLASVKDNLEVFMHKGKADMMIRKEAVKFELMEYIRGRSLRNKFVILDEAQNTTKHGVLTVMSRIEESSKLVVMGDRMQSDVFHREPDGLSDAMNRLRNLEEVGIVEFATSDIIRSSFIHNVIRRYEK